MNSPKILISSCLLGNRVRYDAKIIPVTDQQLISWQQQGLLLAICPEVCGGLSTPRPAAEIQIDGLIKTQQGIDLSDSFQFGAQQTLEMAQRHNIKIAILTEKSPSCGSSQIYNGSFGQQLIAGQGVTCQLLREHGIQVFNQFQLQQVAALLED